MIMGAATSAAARLTSGLGDPNDKTSSGTAPGQEAKVEKTKEEKRRFSLCERHICFVGEFDLYLFAMSWAPRFCCDSPKQCKAESMLVSLSVTKL